MAPDPKVNFAKLIDNVCGGTGGIDCCALRQLLHLMVANMGRPNQPPRQRGNLRSGSTGTSGTNYRVTIDGRELSKTGARYDSTSAYSVGASQRKEGRGQVQRDREQEVILCKLEIVQKMLRELQRKLDRLEKLQGKSPSDDSLGRELSNTDVGGGGSRSRNIRKHYCGVGAPPNQ
uniref:Uncharacterized protein n=1 Tax=Anopheles atroparvus TaxID=41427 RepID=A0A182ILX4_ANOAO